MLTAVVAHTSRATQAAHLQATLGGVMFLDDGRYGAAGNHHRALQWAATQTERVWIVEDDALPGARFHDHATAWTTRYPDHLISGYLGTSHPRQWMRKVDEQWNTPTDHVELPQLIHAVAYTIPTHRIPALLTDIDTHRPADFGIGEAWARLTGLPVIYPKASIVDHDDGPGIANPDREREPRRARQLAQ